MLIRIWGTFADLASMARLYLNEQSFTQPLKERIRFLKIDRILQKINKNKKQKQNKNKKKTDGCYQIYVFPATHSLSISAPRSTLSQWIDRIELEFPLKFDALALQFEIRNTANDSAFLKFCISLPL